MATAAHCSECEANVYVTPDGGCPAGHSPECLSGHYETPEPAVAPEPVQVSGTPTAAGGIPRWVWTVAALLIAMFVIVGGSIAYVTYAAGQASAQEDECFQNQYDIEDAAVPYAQQNGELPDTIGDMVPEFLPEIPKCPAGGQYDLDATLPGASCTEHGWYGDCFT